MTPPPLHSSRQSLPTRRSNFNGWASQWLQALDSDPRVDLLDASRQLYQLRGMEGAEAAADLVIVESRLRAYAEAERAFVDQKTEEHLAATPPPDRDRSRLLYREALQAAATGSNTAGIGIAGTGSAGRAIEGRLTGVEVGGFGVVLWRVDAAPVRLYSGFTSQPPSFVAYVPNY